MLIRRRTAFARVAFAPRLATGKFSFCGNALDRADEEFFSTGQIERPSPLRGWFAHRGETIPVGGEFSEGVLQCARTGPRKDPAARSIYNIGRTSHSVADQDWTAAG